MSGKRVIAIVSITIAAALAVSAIVLFRTSPKERAFVIRGAVVTQDPDPTKQLPIADVQVKLRSGPIAATAKSDDSGYFSIALPSTVQAGQPLAIQFHHPEYQPADFSGSVQDRLY